MLYYSEKYKKSVLQLLILVGLQLYRMNLQDYMVLVNGNVHSFLKENYDRLDKVRARAQVEATKRYEIFIG